MVQLGKPYNHHKTMKLSKKALLLLQAIFSENSGIQVPIGVAKEVIEIKEWIEKELEEIEKEEQKK
jgi:hypothetical protein